jgi:hypothetical protein
MNKIFPDIRGEILKDKSLSAQDRAEDMCSRSACLKDDELVLCKECALRNGEALTEWENFSDNSIAITKDQFLKVMMNVIYLDKKLCPSQNVHGITSQVWDGLNDE